MNDPLVAVILVNWNHGQDTITCLRSLAATEGVPWQAIVVDNASTDDSVARIAAAFPQARLLVNKRNLGFAGGANVGIREALAGPYRYLLLLNNDTQVDPDALEHLRRTAEAHPRAGILSPLILYPDRERIWFAGAHRRRWYPSITWPAYRRRRRLPPQPFQTEYVTGCAMLLRRQVLEEVGLLDEAYFMYWEDLDLCERARRAGWQVWLVPTAVVLHHVSTSTGEHAPRKWYYLARYLPRFYRRYYRRPVLAMSVYAVGVLVQELLRGHRQVLGPYLRGLWDGWREQGN